jgi:hypothetical protein
MGVDRKKGERDRGGSGCRKEEGERTLKLLLGWYAVTFKPRPMILSRWVPNLTVCGQGAASTRLRTAERRMVVRSVVNILLNAIVKMV